MGVPHKNLTSRCIVVAVCMLLALWITSPIVATGNWYHANQAPLNPYRLSQFRNAFAAGFWYPRWMPEMFGGYGYPTFVFYQPGYFFLTLPLTYVTGLLHACEAGIFLALTAGMLGAYKLARIWHSRCTALCFSVLFIFSRDIASTLFTRSDLSELYAMLLFPWHAYFLLRMASAARSRQAMWRGALGFTATSFLIIITHPVMAFWWLPFAAGLLLMEAFFPVYDRSLLLAGTLCFGLALTLAAPYWFTVVQLKHQVHFERGLIPFNIAYGVMIGQKPFLQTWAYAMAAMLGFATAWRQRTMRYVACACVFFLFMSMPWSRQVWEFGYPVLQYTQFSLRLLAPLTVIMYLGILQLNLGLLRLNRKYQHSRQICIGLALAAAIGVILGEEKRFHLLWVMNPAERLQTLDYYELAQKQQRSSLMTATHDDELTPVLAQDDKLPNRYANSIPIAQLTGSFVEGSSITEAPYSTPYHIRLVTDLRGHGIVRINQLYFPGWTIFMNGHRVPWKAGREVNQSSFATPSPEGCIQLAVTHPGVYNVDAWYEGPPGWRARNIVVATITALLMLPVWLVFRTNRATAGKNVDSRTAMLPALRRRSTPRSR